MCVCGGAGGAVVIMTMACVPDTSLWDRVWRAGQHCHLEHSRCCHDVFVWTRCWPHLSTESLSLDEQVSWAMAVVLTTRYREPMPLFSTPQDLLEQRVRAASMQRNAPIFPIWLPPDVAAFTSLNHRKWWGAAGEILNFHHFPCSTTTFNV